MWRECSQYIVDVIRVNKMTLTILQDVFDHNYGDAQ
jgi:hypothetical protein